MTPGSLPPVAQCSSAKGPGGKCKMARLSIKLECRRREGVPHSLRLTPYAISNALLSAPRLAEKTLRW